MKVSIIIPAHNEEKIIEKTLSSVNSVMKKINYSYEIIAVDDNSSDSTASMMKKLSRDKHIKTVHITSRKKGPTGLGSAVRKGFKHASGDVLIPFMGDLSDDPRDIIKLVKKIEQGNDIVCGSRFVEGGKLIDYPPLKLLINRFWNRFFAFLFWMDVKDISNAFKAYRKEVIRKVRPTSKGFEITAEIALKARIEGFRIAEVPVTWYGRKKGEGVSKFGSFSLKFVFIRMPVLGHQYGSLALKLWFKFLSKKLSLQ
jgi:hypothetical protein